ncbi:MAG TPA: hypothetical protein VER08_04615 [Pyrinomonadaceae bacterium]|nr:hypothetical protein [Pyrinomonadaceae bacterium]
MTSHTTRRRDLFIGGSDDVPDGAAAGFFAAAAGAFAATAFATPPLTEGVGVEPAAAAVDAAGTRAAGFVSEGTLRAEGAPAGTPVVPEEAAAAEGVTGVSPSEVAASLGAVAAGVPVAPPSGGVGFCSLSTPFSVS